jgi:hypothetical protein
MSHAENMNPPLVEAKTGDVPALALGTCWVVGARVSDEDGDTGTIVAMEDEHNVHVNLDCGGRAIYCCAEGCPGRFPCRLLPTPNAVDVGRAGNGAAPAAQPPSNS